MYEFFDEDEVLEKYRKYKFGRIEDNDFSKFADKKLLFAYDFIDLDVTQYHFSQQCLDNNDIIIYFQKVKQLSKVTLNDLIDKASHKEHFHIYHRPNSTIIDLLKKISGKQYFRDEELPSVGQIALYTSEVPAERQTEIKSPRIYFIIGAWAILYILFYDPFHEINPGRTTDTKNKNTENSQVKDDEKT